MNREKSVNATAAQQWRVCVKQDFPKVLCVPFVVFVLVCMYVCMYK